MKAALIGLGSFGQYWLDDLTANYPELRIVTIGRDAAQRDSARGLPFYTSLEEAVQAESPDFLINVTPPHVHTEINRGAFKLGLPVLCEKPICEDYAEAEDIVALAEELKVPFVIAENYRYIHCARLAKKLITEGVIGSLQRITIELFRSLKIDKDYLTRRMDHPLLQDVAVHHLDMVRYFTETGPQRIFARSFRTENDYYRGNQHLLFALELEGGISVDYAGTLTAARDETSWTGDWLIQGDKGALDIRDDRVYMIDDDGEEFYEVTEKVDSHSVLTEFILSLEEGREAETCARDNLQTQYLVHKALESCDSGKTVNF